MKKSFLLLSLITISLYTSAQETKIEAFDFFVGKWEMKTKNGKIVEHWKKHSDSLIGTSFRFNVTGDSVLTEAVVLKKIQGEWHYCVTTYQIGYEGKTNFKLIATTDDTFIFENKQHDFPQQITYQNKGKTELLAWIEGEINGNKKKIEFPYKRVF